MTTYKTRASFMHKYMRLLKNQEITKNDCNYYQ
jgi:hypothetical protein